MRNIRIHGVRNLVITGGEPTLYPDFHRLLSYAKSLDFSISLSTNGSLYEYKYLDDILTCLDWLSLPIDGATYSSYKAMRGLSLTLYNNIFRLMEYAKSNYGTNIKIGTVVSRKNINEIDKIANKIYKYADKWKLYQVCLFGKPQDIIDLHYVSNFDYYRKYKTILEDYSCYNLDIVDYSSDSMNSKYLFCEPDGSAMSIIDNKECFFGNFFTGLDKVLNIWEQYVSENKLMQNYNSTYQKRSE